MEGSIGSTFKVEGFLLVVIRDWRTGKNMQIHVCFRAQGLGGGFVLLVVKKE